MNSDSGNLPGCQCKNLSRRSPLKSGRVTSADPLAYEVRQMTLANFPKLSGDPLKLAGGLVTLLAEHDREIDESRSVPKIVMDAICATGLPWMMIPKRAGGAGEKMRTQIEVTAELARGSAGAAWVFGLLSGVTGVTASLPPQTARRIFRTGREL